MGGVVPGTLAPEQIRATVLVDDCEGARIMVSTTGPAPQSPPSLGNVNERLIWVESQLQQVATRAWVLGGVIGGMVAAGSFATAIALIVVRLMAPT